MQNQRFHPKKTGVLKRRDTVLRLLTCVLLVFGHLALVCAAPDPGMKEQEKPEKYALLIGINDYDGDRFQPLMGALNDVQLMKDVLVKRFSFKPENIRMLTNQEATHTGIQKAIQELARNISPGDFVYIHYSGHGSYTCDLNGDEDKTWAKDSTWVSYGARKGQGKDDSEKPCSSVVAEIENGTLMASRGQSRVSIDEYDVLDDEINIWLAKLCAKTEHVVFVSDSCHSGTVTRGGDALATRGVPIDTRAHPMGTIDLPDAEMKGVRVTACRDEEKAREYKEDGKVYGLFTWFFAKALDMADPGESWDTILQRAGTMVEVYGGGSQHPRIEGDRDREVFGASFAKRQPTIPVSYVSHDGKSAKIEAGSLVGVTRGSVYQKHVPASQKEDVSTIEITEVTPTSSRGVIHGSFIVGDLVTLDKMHYETAPMKVFVYHDLDKDRETAKKLAKAIDDLPVFVTTDDQSESDYVALLIRPKKDKNGGYICSGDKTDIPSSFSDAALECWITGPGEHLPRNPIQVDMQDTEKGVQTLCENLEKSARVRRLITLDSAPGKSPDVSLTIDIWEPATPDTRSKDLIHANGKLWKKKTTVSAQDLVKTEIKAGAILTFTIHNHSEKPYYTYLVNVMETGDILPFFPRREYSGEDGLVRPGTSREVTEVNLLLDTPGREYVRLIASLSPINIFVLQQDAYTRKGMHRGSNPLESMLMEKAGYLTRGKAQTGFSVSTWSTVQEGFTITP